MSKPITKAMYRKAIGVLEAGSRVNYLDKLAELFEVEHGGCGDNTCTITKAFEAGYSLIAIDGFASSGAASDKFYKLYRRLPAKALWTAVSYEITCFNSDADCQSIACLCGAYIYNTEFCGDSVYCDNCAKMTLLRSASHE